MILLTSTTDKLQATTTAALATDVQTSYVDNASGTITPDRKNTAISTAATTDIVASPGASTQRAVQYVSILNKGATQQTVTVQHTDGTTVVVLQSAIPLLTGESLCYEDSAGWYVLDATGARKGASLGAGRYLRTVQIAASGNWTPGTGTKQAFIRMVGGGGGGGGANTGATAAAVGGGGGSGAYLERRIAVSEGTAYAAVVGGAGSGGASTGANGQAGSLTSLTIGGVVLTAPAGNGGLGTATAGTTTAPVQGGLGGGVATNGDLNVTGDNGFDGERVSATVAWCGSGGSNPMGSGGRAFATAGTGAAGLRGGGGSGGVVLNGSAAVAGGAGGAGLIIIDEYT